MFQRGFVAILCGLACLFVVAPSTTAFAQDDTAAAKAHYSKASRLYEVGDYREALSEFKAAHLAKPDPAFLYNIAQCHRQLGELGQAVTMYKRFLSASPSAPNRAEVEKRVADLEAELAGAKKSAAPPGAAGPPPATQPVPSSASPPPAPANDTPAVATPPLTAVSAPEPAPSSSLRTLRWVGVGVTAALAGGAIASGLAASSKFNDLEKSCGNTVAGCTSGQIDGVKSRALLTNVLIGLAGVAAVTTGVLFYLAPHESGVQVSWRF